MEIVQQIKNRKWISQEKINIKQFIDDWKNIEIEKELSIDQKTFREKVSDFLKIDDQIITSIENDLNPSNLKEDYQISDDFDIPANTNLNTLFFQKQHLEMCSRKKSYQISSIKCLRHRNDKYLVTNLDPQTTNGSDRRIEALLTVQIYCPTDASRSHAKLDQEFHLVSSNLLTEFKDSITCMADITTPGDCSEDLSLAGKIAARDIYGSSFFFIDTCFYNDMRRNENIDYSEVIINWAKDRDKIGPFTSCSMESTYVRDLTIRLGLPYIYVHQGNCEHMVVFTDVALMSLDSLALSMYPRLIKISKKIGVTCSVCSRICKWITHGNKRCPEEWMFWCEECFKMFNYDSENKKIGQFTAYSYLDNKALV